MRQSAMLGLRAGLLLLLVACGHSGGSPWPQPGGLPEAPSGSPLVTLVLVGDTTGSGQDDLASRADPLEAMAWLLSSRDVFVFNHEGALYEPGMACPGWPWDVTLRAPVRTARWFARAPLNVATLANNHVLDCGEQGLRTTIQELESRGILTLGAGLDLEAACTSRTISPRGHPVTFLNFQAYDQPTAGGDPFPAGPHTPGVATWDACDGPRVVRDYKVKGHVVIVALHLHLGPSYRMEPHPGHRELVAEVLDAGADLVVGHGPHVPHGVLVRAGGVGFLSLGNFLFRNGVAAPPYWESAVVCEAQIHERATFLALHPIRIPEHGRPRPAYGKEAQDILAALAYASRQEGVDLFVDEDRAFLLVDRESGP